MSICVCGLAKQFHEGEDSLAYREPRKCPIYLPKHISVEVKQLIMGAYLLGLKDGQKNKENSIMIRHLR